MVRKEASKRRSHDPAAGVTEETSEETPLTAESSAETRSPTVLPLPSSATDCVPKMIGKSEQKGPGVAERSRRGSHEPAA